MPRKNIVGANPFLPLWEHIPDGEPRVFTHNGQTRVYLYGSHDTLKTEYCGRDQVVWSASVNDLTKWKCHGVCYKSINGGILYAPDVVKKGDTYYLYAAEDKGSKIYVAKSDNPAGPFTDSVLTELGFDPGILVDDDGRVYAYWGFCDCFCAELNDDMATIKPGTLHEHPMGHAKTDWNPDTEYVNYDDGFFEASSPRKIMGKYVYIYSKRYNTPVQELGVKGDCNGFLSYKYSDKPLEGFIKGGDISFNGGEIVKLKNGEYHMTYQWGNNHGSLCEIDEKWYIFYHRQTGVNEYSRQAMLEPVDVAMDDEGHLFIGKVEYENKNGFRQPVSSGVVEMTSSGPMVDGIDAYSFISAGYACHIFRKDVEYEPFSTCNAYVKPVYMEDIGLHNYDECGTADEHIISAPVVNIQSGYTVGFRYLQFGGNNQNQTVSINVRAFSELRVNVRVGAYDGEIIGTAACVPDDDSSYRMSSVELCKPIDGKQVVYFEFVSTVKCPDDEAIAEFDGFYFDR